MACARRLLLALLPSAAAALVLHANPTRPLPVTCTAVRHIAPRAEFGDAFYMGHMYEGKYGPKDGINTLPEGVVEVSLEKPLGIMFEENGKFKGVSVIDVVADSNAAKSEQVLKGDYLVGITAVRLQGAKFERQMFDCRKWDFDTVVDAIGSNEEKFGCKDVILQLKRSTEVE